MSTDRFLSGSPAADARPRVGLAYARAAGRPPRYPDEVDAISVVDLLPCGDASHDLCGGRFVYVRQGDQCEVKHLPRWQP